MQTVSPQAADAKLGLFPITYWVRGPARRNVDRAIMDCGFTLAQGPDHWATRNLFGSTTASRRQFVRVERKAPDHQVVLPDERRGQDAAYTDTTESKKNGIWSQ